jgi:hypothetical protein
MRMVKSFEQPLHGHRSYLCGRYRSFFDIGEQTASDIDKHQIKRDVPFKLAEYRVRFVMVVIIPVDELFNRLLMDKTGDVMQGAAGGWSKILFSRVE